MTVKASLQWGPFMRPLRRQNLALPRRRDTAATSPLIGHRVSAALRYCRARKTRSLEGLVENTLRISEYYFQRYNCRRVAIYAYCCLIEK